MSGLATVRQATEADWDAVTRIAQLSYSPEAQAVLKRLEAAAKDAAAQLEALKAKEAAVSAREAALAEAEQAMEERVQAEFRARLRAAVGEG